MISTSNQTTPIPSAGYIQVTNFGHYLASFTVSYSYAGSRFISSSGILTAYPSTISIPQGATSILVDISGYYDPSYLESICVKYFDEPVTKCYILYGTIGNWGCRDFPCSTNTPPSNSCCSCCCNCTCNNYCNNLY